MSQSVSHLNTDNYTNSIFYLRKDKSYFWSVIHCKQAEIITLISGF